MTQLSHQPQEKPKDAYQQWENLPDYESQYRPRSSTTAPSGSGAVRAQSTTNQPAVLPTSSPHKHTPSDYRSPIRARAAPHERGYVVEQPPQGVLRTPDPEKSHQIKQRLRESTGCPVPQHVSPTKRFLEEPKGDLIPQSSSTARLPQRLLGNPFPSSVSRLEPSSQALEGTPRQELSKILSTSLKHVLRYIAEVLCTVLRIVKYPISNILAIVVCAYALAFMLRPVKSALAPMCSIPLISLLCPAGAPVGPSRAPNPQHTPVWADFPSLMKVENKTLESLIDETLEGAGLALEIKKAEMATSDLVTLVGVSDMDSRKVLKDALSAFEKDARKVSRGLTRFGSKVGGAVDNIIAINDYALHRIEAASEKPSGLSIRRLWWRPSSEAATKQVVTRTFTEAMNVLSTNMKRLILEAEVSISDLNKLEKHLKSIHKIVSREKNKISTARHELGAQVLTIFGVNRDQLRGMDENLELLKGVGGYRDRARAHVVAVLEVLRLMADDMEELRGRVAAPDLAGDAIPIDVHIKSLRGGLERLKGRRTGAKQLREQLMNQVV